jgi:hypothetical protein
MYMESCGQTLNRLVQGIFVVTLLVLSGNPICARDTLARSSGIAAANGSATLSQALTGSGASAVNCWTLTCPFANVVSISASALVAGAHAAKTLSGGAPNTDSCVASAIGAGAVSHGSVAIVNLILAAALATTTVGAGHGPESTPAGNAIALLATGGTVKRGAFLPAVASLSNRQATPIGSGRATCAVNLTSTALAPASVRVAVASTPAATFGAAPTAAHYSSSPDAGIRRVATMTVFSRACNTAFERPAEELTPWQCYLLAKQSS